MFAKGDGTPGHLFPNCPYVKRMTKGTDRALIYRLSDEARTLKGVRCKWCRSHLLDLMVNDPEIPPEIATTLALVPREDSKSPLP